MAADVAVPAKPIMDIFKGSSDSELQNSPRSRSRNSRKAKGILDFFNSSCRSSIPNAQKTNVCDSAVGQVMDTTDCQIVKGTFHEMAQSDKHLSHNGSEDIKRKSQKKGKNTEITLTKEPSKPRKQTKTNKRTVVDLKPDSAFTETEPEIVEENERSFGKQENNSSLPQEIDYEDFKRTLLHNGQENASVPQIELESNLMSPKHCSKHFNIADEEEPASKIHVIEKEQLDTQESGSSESDRRQSRPRMRKIYHQTDMCGFAVCPALTPSPKSATDKDKSESDISLQGKDILEMTYEEYLKSIGASFEDVDESTNKEKVNDKTQVNLVAENVQGTKGSSTILNYFSKAQRKSEESSIVIIHADVHSQPNMSKESQKDTRKPVCKREQSIHTKQPSSPSSDMEIIFLGTETLEQSVEEEKSKMAETNNSDTVDKNTENYNQSPVKKKLNFLTEKSTSVGTSWNKAQSTLQFRQDGGLEMVKSVKPVQHSTPLVDADTTKSQTKVDICKNISVRKGKCEEASDLCNNSICLLDDDKQDEHADQVRTKALNKFAKHEKEMDDTNDSKDFTPRSRRASTIAQARAQELLQKARQQVQPANNKSSKEETPERSSEISSHGESSGKDCNRRRQSSRLIHQHQVEGQKLYIEVETSDSEEEVDHSSTYKSAGADCSLLSRSKEKAVQESSKKLGTGKLAPIFSKKRSTNQPETMASQSSENPEAVRKRREFLMSGVPSELKCQIQPIEPLLVGAEYAPLPTISHVQQKEFVEDGNLDVWSLPCPKLRLDLRSENYIEDMCIENVKWNLLGWTTLSQKEDNLPNLPALDEITTEQNHALLQVLSKSDPSFPFAGVYENLKVRLNKTSGKRGILKDTIGGTIAKSSKRHLSDDIDVMIVDDIEEPATLQTCQWTEALQPTLVSELVGNVDSLRRLQTWLEEWKKHIQSEVRRSSDSESDPNDIDSDEDSSQLCNTMLLVGPHGVGKTSAVYALAQQLSYKVFEVSASSSRQGRHILAQLQEATQSHQVVQNKDGIIHKHSVANEKSPTKRCVKKPERGVCKAFEHFFKKSTKDSPKKEGTKKRKLESSLEAGQSPKKLRDGRVKSESSNKEETKRVTSAVDDGGYAGCINLISTSLILFDEVDIVFEEDSGFLQTVQHFISTTKIPIIMTTADPGFGRELNARFEQLIFTVPPLHSINSYLQIISLAAGVRTSPEDLQSLATMCSGDLRHLILTLQFFILSGGSRVRESLPLDSISVSEKGSGEQDTKTELSRLNPSQFSIAAKCSNDSDFISLKLRRKRSRRIQDEESDNKVINDCEPGKSNLLKAGKSGTVVLDGQTLPMVHSHLCESMLGVSQDLKSLLLQCLEDSTLSPAVNKLVSECLKLRIHKIDVVYSNLMQLLPLPKTVMPNRLHPPLASDCVRGRNRIRIADVYDSEASDDESVPKIAKVARTNVTVNTDQHGTHGKQITSDRKNAPSDDKSEVKEEQSKSGEHFSCKILSNFAHYYDSVSLVDTWKCTNNNFPNPMTDRHFRLLSGLADVAALEPDDDSCSLSQETSVEVGVQAARHLWQTVKCYVDEWKQLSGKETIDGCSLPLHSNRSTKLVLEKEFEEISVPKTYRDVVESVTSNLPLTCYHSHRPVSLDYLPALRSISNAEQLRQVAKAKRRFHHYFDNIGLCLNATTLKALGSSFPTVQETGIEN